jgi:glycyl-tRNA synthetase beta chain
LPAEVADAIRDHYKPVGQGDDVPTAPVTVAVSLADKLDTLVGLLPVRREADRLQGPFALRRAALGMLSLILDNGLRVEMFDLITAAAHPAWFPGCWPEIAGFPVGAAQGPATRGRRSSRPDRCGRLARAEQRQLADHRRVHALQAFIGTEDGANLHVGYKRAANILKKEDWQGIEGEIAPHWRGRPASRRRRPRPRPGHRRQNGRETRETAFLHARACGTLADRALDSAGLTAAAAIEAEDFEAAMAALASLRAPIDRFFDEVTVNDADPDKRAARLDLLARFRAAVHNVADFSRIEG